MPRLLERVGKLRQASINELQVRCAQAARARLERVGLSRDGRQPTDIEFARLFDSPKAADVADSDELLTRFRENARLAGRFLPGLVDPQHTAGEFGRRSPDAAAATIAAAERIAGGQLDLGDRRVTIGARPDWTLEPRSGKRAPAIHWSRIAFLDPLVAGDCKLTWELNRHQYFVTLGQAYQLTGDDRYASIVVDHLSSWLEDNQPKIGINWTSSLEASFRAISWIWALYLLRHSPRLEGSFFLRILKSLYLHARHIESNLSTYFSPNTHLTGEALGLLYLGAAFPEFKLATHWRSLGARILAEELDRQILADGVYFEQSTYYHRYTADFYLHALLLTQATEPWLATIVRPSLHRLLDYLVFITRPDGTSPLIGDEDGGRLVMLGQRATNDFRDTLAIGATLLGRGDCAWVAGQSIGELAWLLGPSGLCAYDALTSAPPATTSRAFSQSGYYVMRDGWDKTADWALVRCGPHGSPLGAHAHADALTLELCLGGHAVFVDAGTYCYTASREDREYFRGSAAHNTVTLDEHSSAEPGHSAFKWQSVPTSRGTAWVTTAAFDFFEGEHDGYHRLASPATHSRAVFLLKGEYCVIRDRIRGAGEHRVTLRLHWPPGVTLCAKSQNILEAQLAKASARRVEARIFARHGDLSCEGGWVSPAYAVRTPAPVSLFRLDSEGSEEIVTIIASSASSLRLEESAWTASDHEAGALTLELESGSDTILTEPTADAAHNDIVSDAAWTWVRRSRTGALLAFAVVRGSNLVIDNCRVFHADSVVDCVIGRRDGDGWSIEPELLTGMITAQLSTTNGIEESCVGSVE